MCGDELVDVLLPWDPWKCKKRMFFWRFFRQERTGFLLFLLFVSFRWQTVDDAMDLLIFSLCSFFLLLQRAAGNSIFIFFFLRRCLRQGECSCNLRRWIYCEREKRRERERKDGDRTPRILTFSFLTCRSVLRHTNAVSRTCLCSWRLFYRCLFSLLTLNSLWLERHLIQACRRTPVDSPLKVKKEKRNCWSRDNHPLVVCLFSWSSSESTFVSGIHSFREGEFDQFYLSIRCQCEYEQCDVCQYNIHFLSPGFC